MNECEQICYQQWVDMYNKKDKECFELQLKLARIEELCKNQDILRGRQALASTILKIIRGEE